MVCQSYKRSKKYGNVNIAASSAAISYKKYPAPESWNLNEKSDYLHLVMNETIDGVCLRDLNNLPDSNIVADCSSCILSEPLDISKFGLIYAGAQKILDRRDLQLLLSKRIC